MNETADSTKAFATDTVVLCIGYAVATAALMVFNQLSKVYQELPWTWYWVLWSTCFAPVVAVAVISAAGTGVGPIFRRRLYALTLLVIIVTLEASFVSDVRPSTLAVSVAAGGAAVAGSFWWARSIPSNGQ